jgi:hypothetical protein
MYYTAELGTKVVYQDPGVNITVVKPDPEVPALQGLLDPIRI